MFKKKIYFPILIILFSCTPTLKERTTFQETFFGFDTVITITLVADELFQQKFYHMIKKLKQLMLHYDLLFNNYNKKSAISKLHSLKPNQFYTINKELYNLLKDCKKYYSYTEGAFDITIGKITQLYNFHNNTIPSTNELKTNLSYIGMDKVLLTNGQIKILKEGMTFDLGGVAKGYIVDRFVDYIKSQRCSNFIVNFGGDLYAAGKNEKNKKWVIGIQHPRHTEQIIRKVEVSHQAIVTSGDYERYLLRKNKKYHHILNPKTGLPVWNDIISVTIIGPDTQTADYIATAFFVMGKVKGKKFLKKYYKNKVNAIIY